MSRNDSLRVSSVKKKGYCSRVIAKDIWGKLVGPRRCVGEGSSSKMVEIMIDTLLRVPLEERLMSGMQVEGSLALARRDRDFFL